MTVTTTLSEFTLNTFEWRSYAVMAAASETIVRVAKQSNIGQRAQREFLYGRILLDVRSLSGLMLDLLNLYHAPDAILALEAATPEQLSRFAEQMNTVHFKIRQTVAMIHPNRYWRNLYRPYLEKVNAYNEELASHARAFTTTDSALILLTKRDQDHLLEALSSSIESNAASRRTFAGK